MDQVNLPFTMTAAVGHADAPEPAEDTLPTGWVRIPVSFQIMLPQDVLDGATPANAAGGTARLLPQTIRLGAIDDAGMGQP